MPCVGYSGWWGHHQSWMVGDLTGHKGNHGRQGHRYSGSQGHRDSGTLGHMDTKDTGTHWTQWTQGHIFNEMVLTHPKWWLPSYLWTNHPRTNLVTSSSPPKVPTAPVPLSWWFLSFEFWVIVVPHQLWILPPEVYKSAKVSWFGFEYCMEWGSIETWGIF